MNAKWVRVPEEIQPVKIQLIIFWSFVRRGNILGLIKHYIFRSRHGVAEAVADHPLLIAKILRFVPLMVAILAAVFAYAFGGLDTPGKALLTAAALTCSLWLAIGSLGSFVLAGPVLIPLSRLWKYAGLRALLFFAPAGILAWWLSGRPEQQAWAIAVCAILWFTLHSLLERLAEALVWQKKRRLKRLTFGEDRHVLNDDEIWRVAVHEAGHLLLYGELERLPEDAMGVIDKEPKYAFGGFVLPPHMESALEATTDMLRWQATLAYAGGAAEYLVFGSNTEGSKSDHEQADQFIMRLAAVLHIDYFPTPSNSSEEQANITAICRIREDCKARAAAFLSANKAQLLQVAEMLKATESVDCEQFYPIWQSLQLPEGWSKVPVPSRLPCLASDGKI